MLSFESTRIGTRIATWLAIVTLASASCLPAQSSAIERFTFGIGGGVATGANNVDDRLFGVAPVVVGDITFRPTPHLGAQLRGSLAHFVMGHLESPWKEDEVYAPCDPFSPCAVVDRSIRGALTTLVGSTNILLYSDRAVRTGSGLYYLGGMSVASNVRGPSTPERTFAAWNAGLGIDVRSGDRRVALELQYVSAIRGEPGTRTLIPLTVSYRW